MVKGREEREGGWSGMATGGDTEWGPLSSFLAVGVVVVEGGGDDIGVLSVSTATASSFLPSPLPTEANGGEAADRGKGNNLLSTV